MEWPSFHWVYQTLFARQFGKKSANFKTNQSHQRSDNCKVDTRSDYNHKNVSWIFKVSIVSRNCLSKALQSWMMEDYQVLLVLRLSCNETVCNMLKGCMHKKCQITLVKCKMKNKNSSSGFWSLGTYDAFDRAA